MNDSKMTTMIAFFLIVYPTFFLLCHGGLLPASQQSEQTLIRALLSGYDKTIRPDTQVYVDINANIQQIVTIDEKQQIMTSSSMISQVWIDERLSWTPNASNNNVQVVMIPVKSLWIPDTMIINSADVSGYLPVSDYSYAAVQNDGQVYMVLPALTVKTRCTMNVQRFPFDTQMCSINLTSWSQGSNRIVYTENSSIVISTEEYIEHALWDLKKTDMMVIRSDDRSAFENTYNDVISIQLYVARKPLFFIMNGIFACLILNCVTLISFLLPYATQISLSMVCFMTYSVYSLNFSNLFPQQSAYIMMITLYFLLSIGWTLVSMAWFVICNQLMNRSEMPHHLDRFCQFLQKYIWCCAHGNNKINDCVAKETGVVEATTANVMNVIVDSPNGDRSGQTCNFCQRCTSCQAEHKKNELKSKNKKILESKCQAINYFVLFCITIIMLSSNIAIWISMSQ